MIEAFLIYFFYKRKLLIVYYNGEIYGTGKKDITESIRTVKT